MGSITASATGPNAPPNATVTSPNVIVNPGAGALVQLVLPGETAAPGTASGKTGTPQTLTAGKSVTLTVAGTDLYWNVQPTANRLVAVTSNDPYAAAQSAHVLGGTGQTTFTFIPRIATTALNVQAADTDIVVPQLATMTVTNVTVIVDTSTAKLQIIMPGEVANPGQPPYAGITGGKTGQPDRDGNNANGIDPFVAGQNITASVMLVDNQWNLITTGMSMPVISITTPNDSFDVLPATQTLVSGTRELHRAARRGHRAEIKCRDRRLFACVADSRQFGNLQCRQQ